MKIIKIEIKQASNGNNYKQISLDEKKNDKDRFNVFQDHTMYEELVVGYPLDPNMLTFDGKYLNLTDPDKGIKRPYTGKKSNASITKAMERKEQSIEKFADKKEFSIMVSGTARDATLILTTLFPIHDTGNWQEKWLEIRQWLLENHEVDPQDIPPFKS